MARALLEGRAPAAATDMEEKRKINILFIIDYLWDVGGTEYNLYNLVKHLDRSRFNCYVVAFDLGEMFVKQLRAEGAKVYHVPLKRIYTPDALCKAFWLRRIIKKHDIDIVQTYHFNSDTYGALVARYSGVKNIVSSKRDTGFNRKKRHFLLNRMANTRIRRFIMVSDAVSEVVGKLESIPMYKRITIYNGVDLEKFSVPDRIEQERLRNKFGIAKDDFVIGSVAHFRPEKNHDVFFQAVASLRHSIKNLKVVAIGQGTTINQCKQFCRDNSLEGIVMFPGNVENVREFMAVMDVGCLVSGTEGLSNAVLETMAMGRPMIVTAVGGNIEAVLDGYNGILIPPHDHDKLQEAISYLYFNASEREEMGRRSRERIAQIFSMKKMIENHEALYEQLVKGNAKAESYLTADSQKRPFYV